MTVINELPTGARRVVGAHGAPAAAQVPGPLEKVEQAAEELAKTDAPKPPPGVVRVQVEEPRITATSLLWSGSMSAVGGAQPADHDPVPHLLHPAVGQDVQAEVRRARGSDADEEENHARDHRQHLVADRPLSHRADLHERRRRRVDVGRARMRSASSRPRYGGCSPASSTPFRTTVRSSSAAAWRSSHFCSSARST